MNNHTLLCNRIGHEDNEILVACMNSECQNPILCCIKCMTQDHQTHIFTEMSEIKTQVKQKLDLLIQISQISFQIYQFSKEQYYRTQKIIEEFKQNFAIFENMTLTQLTNSVILIKKNSYQQNINNLISKYQDLYNQHQQSFLNLFNQTSNELSQLKQIPQPIQIQKPKSIQIQDISNQLETVYLEYVEKYQSYLSNVNIIDFAIADAYKKLFKDSEIAWAAVALKRFYQIRMVLQMDLELKQNSFQLQHFDGFVTSQKYNHLLKSISNKNEISKTEVESSLLQAVELLTDQSQKQSILFQSEKQILLPLLNMDISKDVGDQAFDCLFTKLNARINDLIIKCKSGQDYSKLPDYLRLKYKILLACGVLSLPIYTIDKETFNEQKFNRIDELNQKAQIESECKEIELKLKRSK